jgi:hypothetical protein
MEKEPLCYMLKLRNLKKRQSLIFSLTMPERVPRPDWYLKMYSDISPYWQCAYSIKKGRQTIARVASGDTWLGALTGALEGMRLAIPEAEERDWKTPEGLDSWCVLPRIIPFGWGYELYSQIARMSDNAEQEFIEGIEARRIARKRMAGGDSSEEPGTG